MAHPRRDVVVLGGGMWGVVLAQQVVGGAARVRLWEFVPDLARSLERTRRHPQIPGFRLDGSVRVSSDIAASCAGAELLIFVLPSRAVASSARAVAKTRLSARAVAVNASKGLEAGTLATMGQVIARELPVLRGRVWTLSGPSFAREVARGIPSCLLLGGPSNASARELAALFGGGAVNVSLWPDRTGVELGGSLKNAIAIGAGILDGLGAGANTKAALMVRGLEEMSQLIRAAGGRADTVYGLAGLGDLIATGTSAESRNRAFGEKLGRGLPPRRARAQIATVVEGVEAVAAARALARRNRVRAPLLEAISAAVGGGPARGVLDALGFHGRSRGRKHG